jgi:hypothetical protein
VPATPAHRSRAGKPAVTCVGQQNVNVPGFAVRAPQRSYAPWWLNCLVYLPPALTKCTRSSIACQSGCGQVSAAAAAVWHLPPMRPQSASITRCSHLLHVHTVPKDKSRRISCGSQQSPVSSCKISMTQLSRSRFIKPGGLLCSGWANVQFNLGWALRGSLLPDQTLYCVSWPPQCLVVGSRNEPKRRTALTLRQLHKQDWE